MRVTAVLAWFDERPEDLERCVRGIAVAADKLIAVDGAYARYPNAAIRSPLAQELAIRRTAAEVGLQVRVYIPDRLWAGQVEKRSFMFSVAAPTSDWVEVVDADWSISGDREQVRAELDHFRAAVDVVRVDFHTPAGDQVASGWHQRAEGTTISLPHFFRSLPQMRVERFHWQYGAVKNGQPVWLWGNRDATRPLVRQYPLRSPYRIEHLSLQRSEAQVRASRAFLNDRVKVVALTGQEDDQPGLPPPEFDFDTMPYV